jgi:hypothetical protein
MIAKVPKVPPWVTTTDVPIPLGEAIVMSDQTTFVELSVAITVRLPMRIPLPQLNRSTGVALVTALVAVVETV